jgi:hypothetical protein
MVEIRKGRSPRGPRPSPRRYAVDSSQQSASMSSHPVHWSIPPTQGTVPTRPFLPQCTSFNPQRQGPRRTPVRWHGAGRVKCPRAPARKWRVTGRIEHPPPALGWGEVVHPIRPKTITRNPTIPQISYVCFKTDQVGYGRCGIRFPPAGHECSWQAFGLPSEGDRR